MKNKKTENKKWLSVVEAAEYLGISKETIYRLIESDNIPKFRIGKLWKFKTTDLDQWIESGKASKI